MLTIAQCHSAAHQLKHCNIGWLDDSMTMGGPTEEDTNFIADTGASTAEMAEQVAAYQESMLELKQKVVPIGVESDASFRTGGLSS